jgi:hypothetical protein
MKKLLIAFSMTLAMLFSANSVKAQTIEEGVNNLLAAQAGLINVGIVVQDVTIQDLIDIGAITVTDVIDINNVLNNVDVNVLNGLLVNVELDNVLNNLLRQSEIISRNQIVVGILSGQLVVMDQKANTKTKKK